MGTHYSVDRVGPPGYTVPGELTNSRAHDSGRKLLILVAALVFLANIAVPPHLMDDVDAVQAQIARNMLTSGDWVTARLDGVPYLEKSPGIYWMMAISYRVFGVHDWSARLPLALSCILLCWVVYRFGCWAFDEETGFYAGIALATSTGLYLFTRILIPDAIVTLTITLAIWSWLRLLDEDEERPALWSVVLGASLGTGLLLKGLIAVLFPLLASLLFMSLSGEIMLLQAWRRLRLPLAVCVCAVIALPWHILVILHNPPYFAFSMHSGPGEYHGFFWFYFINEHLLRFLNKRYPRDYNTVPRLWFWALNLVWLFPWSFYLPGAFRLDYSSRSRQGRARLMAVCWIAVVMLFFTFSTTQEYYSMPIYPAVALLIACALRSGKRFVATATTGLLVLTAALSAALLSVLGMVQNYSPKGDISQALNQHPEMYTLSMGHLGDLTLQAFAYLKLPLFVAALAFGCCAGGLAVYRRRTYQSVLVLAAGMILFFQASRLALSRFDSYLGSYPIAALIREHPPDLLIEANSYYAFSSVFFYTGRKALLLNGRNNNLEYGSYAPDAPMVFIGDQQFAALWQRPGICYLLAYGSELPHLKAIVGSGALHIVAINSGNYLLSNHARH
jgi:4-amino-4-deoxy-L-arabinose transferase-like glycosyltransferase